jgi:hypothetical protein
VLAFYDLPKEKWAAQVERIEIEILKEFSDCDHQDIGSGTPEDQIRNSTKKETCAFKVPESKATLLYLECLNRIQL